MDYYYYGVSRKWCFSAALRALVLWDGLLMLFGRVFIAERWCGRRCFSDWLRASCSMDNNQQRMCDLSVAWLSWDTPVMKERYRSGYRGSKLRYHAKYTQRASY